MAKKRVHELAKELGLDNKAMVAKLVEWGYDIKTHSSSLEEDEARAVVDRVTAERRPAPKIAGGGVVIRRSRPRSETAAPSEPEAAHPPAEPVSVAPPESEPAEAAPAPEAPAAESAPAAVEPVPAPVPESVPAPAAPAPAPETAPLPLAAKAPAAPTAVPAAKAPGAAPRPPPPGVAMRTRAQVEARGGAAPTFIPGRTAPPPAAPQPIAGIDRPLADDEEIKLVNGVPHIVKKAIAGRPTANTAVLLSRPVFIEKRATPAPVNKDAIPMAPGIRPGMLQPRVVEVNYEGGRVRDLTDLKKGKKPSGIRNEKVENYSKQDLIDLVRSRTYVPVIGRKKRPTKKGKRTEITEMKASKKVIAVEETVALRELSERMGVKATDLIRKLMQQTGKPVTINAPVDFDTASLLAGEYGWEVQKRGFEVEDFIPKVEDKPEDMKPRPPVVTVMGHVDHGKTSLLDAIRQADVAAGEAGGITQHIGAYSVTVPGKGDVTFLDTPGHEAFSAMRERGAQATDIVVLVVAVDDGVQPQTLESIKHAKGAEVAIVVAINKIDKQGSNPDAVKGALASNGLQPEDWGGDTPMVPVSARQKTNLDLLLENVLLQAEVLELASNPKKMASGLIIEARLERGRGPVATVLVQDGTLRSGDAVVSGTCYGRVRAMTDDRGRSMREVTAGYPVQIVGLSGAPMAGDDFHAVTDENVAKKIGDHRALKSREADLVKSAKVTIEDLVRKTAADAPKELLVMVKADVQGSAEAVSEALEKLSGRKVVVKVLSRGVGTVSESDVNQAAATGALVVGFNSKPDANAAAVAQQAGVKVKTYGIIYELLDDVRVAMEDLLEPIYREKALGKAEVRQVFNLSKIGVIAGSSVTEGKALRGAQVRVVRDKKVVHSGKVASLKRFKEDVREVPAGMECGIGVENFAEFQPADVLDMFEIETLRQKLE